MRGREHVHDADDARIDRFRFLIAFLEKGDFLFGRNVIKMVRDLVDDFHPLLFDGFDFDSSFAFKRSGKRGSEFPQALRREVACVTINAIGALENADAASVSLATADSFDPAVVQNDGLGIGLLAINLSIVAARREGVVQDLLCQCFADHVAFPFPRILARVISIVYRSAKNVQ